MSHGPGAPPSRGGFRVLQVTPAYSPSVGGVETCVREVSTRLIEGGTNVVVLTADPSHGLPAKELIDGVPVERVRAWPRDRDHRFAPGIFSAVHTSSADVVHVQCYQTFVAPLAMWAAAHAKVPFVLTFHGGGHSSPWRRRIRARQLKLLRPLLARAAALVATAEWEIDEYSELLGLSRDRFVLIPNGGDLPEPRQDEVERSGTLIVSIGRAERYKGHHLVLEAFPHVLREFKDARLWIAGEGPYVPELRKLAGDLGVEHRVEVGVIRDRDEYTRRLAGASVATLFSDFETHPMGALEAIKLGIPTLVADNSGLGELARKGQADAVSLDADSRSHADSIISLIRKPPGERQIEISSWDECSASLRRLYATVTHEAPAPPNAPGANGRGPATARPISPPQEEQPTAELEVITELPEAADDFETELLSPPVPAADDEEPSRADEGEQTGGRPPVVAVLLGALGLAIVGVSFYLSRTGAPVAEADVCFWIGFVVMLGPSIVRSLAAGTPRSHRVFLVVFVGTLIYAVKVIYSPQMFVLGDELIHLSVAQQVASAHSLFAPVTLEGSNVAADYPGLESATVALSNVSGLSLLVTGLIVIGIARVIMMLALFRFAELVTRSTRIAGVAPIIATASGNFLFWSAQFSYESLALPLFVVSLGVLISRGRATTKWPHDVVLLLIGSALIATHHLTSYGLAAVLWVVALLSMRRSWRGYRPLVPAVLITAGAAAWYSIVATGTKSYLSYIYDRGVTSIQQTLSSGSVHAPFQSGSGSGSGSGSASGGSLQTSLPEEIIALVSVAIIAIGIVTVILRYRRTGVRVSPGSLLGAGAALGFLALYPLRIAPGVWESANRGQEFFFFGAATTLAVAAVAILRAGSARRTRIFGVTGVVLLVIAGGVIEGWPAPLRLPLPLRVSVDSRAIVPQGLDTVRWALHHLGQNNVFVGDQATGRELTVGGARFTYMGGATGATQVLEEPSFQPWELQFLRHDRVDYVVVDRRQLASDNLEGYFFQPAATPDGGQGYFPPAATKKFSRLPLVSAVFDSGDIRVYDVRGLWSAPPVCRDVDLSLPGAVSCLGRQSLVSTGGPGGVVTFPTWQVSYLGAEVLTSQTGAVTISVRIQVQNLSSRPLVFSADSGHASFVAGHSRLRRVRVPSRADDLAGTQTVRAGGQINGSLSFAAASPAAIAAVRRSGVALSIRSDALVTSLQTGSTPRFEVARFEIPAGQLG